MASIRAVERACHSIVRFEMQFDVVVVGTWGKDCTMALCSSSDVLVVGCSHIQSAH